MIRLCKNIFYTPKYGNDADTVMMKKLFSTVAIVLVCLAAISLSAYAFFSQSVTSGTNILQSSTFSTTVTIQGSDGGIITQGNIQVHTFSPGQYTITITRDNSANGSGFCIIRIGEDTYYTQQLGTDLNAPGGQRNAISFGVDIQQTTIVSFAAHWGTTSYYASATETEFYIKDADPLMVLVVGGTEPIINTPDETTPQETTPTESTESTEPPAVIHIVAQDESLAQIADLYGTTYQRIAAYNGIENPRLIQPGQEIQIPPADWVEPAASAETTE